MPSFEEARLNYEELEREIAPLRAVYRRCMARQDPRRPLSSWVARLRARRIERFFARWGIPL